MAARKKLFKVVILGDSQVGKTSILHQLVDERFTQQYRPTVGADLMAKELQIDGNSVTLQIWDTAGQERFQNLGGSFYKGSDLCILTFDITNEDTFNSLDQWKAAFLEYSSAEENGSVPFVLLGNKVDRDVDRKVTSDQANNWCNRNGRIQYYEVSAKENIRIKEAFEAVGKAVLTSTKDESVIMPVANLNNRPGQHDNASKCSC